MEEKLIQRCTRPEHTSHWVVVTYFAPLAVSGLTLFYSVSFWLTGIFGAPQLTRMVYPIIGVVTFLGSTRQPLRYWHHSFIDKEDVKWITSALKVLKGYEVGDVGKYSGGQKGIFWLITACMLVSVTIGVIARRLYFAQHFSIPVTRLALLMHA